MLGLHVNSAGMLQADDQSPPMHLPTVVFKIGEDFEIGAVAVWIRSPEDLHGSSKAVCHPVGCGQKIGLRAGYGIAMHHILIIGKRTDIRLLRRQYLLTNPDDDFQGFRRRAPNLAVSGIGEDTSDDGIERHRNGSSIDCHATVHKNRPVMHGNLHANETAGNEIGIGLCLGKLDESLGDGISKAVGVSGRDILGGIDAGEGVIWDHVGSGVMSALRSWRSLGEPGEVSPARNRIPPDRR